MTRAHHSEQRLHGAHTSKRFTGELVILKSLKVGGGDLTALYAPGPVPGHCIRGLADT